MTGYTEQLGLDPSRLKRRIGFLLDRATQHDEQAIELVGEGGDLHRVCAATLRRDAAATAALLGEIDKAQDLFALAGRQWLGLGFYYGVFLLRLAGASKDLMGIAEHGELEWIARSLEGESEPEDSSKRPFERSARNVPRQLLSLVQAEVGIPSKTGSSRGQARERLHAANALPVGGTAMPLRGYLKLLDALEQGDMGRTDRDRLLAQLVQREEMIAAAREDHFHWRLARKPAEIIDFDFLALGLAVQNAGDDMQDTVRELSEGRGAASVPFKLARDLGRGES
jgi:hypothetical protein